MSTVRFEKVFGGQCAFEQVPTPSAFQLQEGHFWNDVTQKNILARLNGATGSLVQGININVTPVTQADPNTTAKNLMSIALPAGYQNVAGKTLRVWGEGTYVTAGGQSPTVTIALTLGGVTPVTWTSTATTASMTKTWHFEAYITTVTAGATGTLEAHGALDIELGGTGAGAVAVSKFNDAVIAVSSTLDLTAANTLQVTGLMSSANAGNSLVQRQMVVEVLN